jgi:hypothetical protein
VRSCSDGRRSIDPACSAGGEDAHPKTIEDVGTVECSSNDANKEGFWRQSMQS